MSMIQDNDVYVRENAISIRRSQSSLEKRYEGKPFIQKCFMHIRDCEVVIGNYQISPEYFTADCFNERKKYSEDLLAQIKLNMVTAAELTYETIIPQLKQLQNILAWHANKIESTPKLRY